MKFFTKHKLIVLSVEDLKNSIGKEVLVENLDIPNVNVTVQEVNDLYIDLYCDTQTYTYRMKNYGKTWFAYQIEEVK